MGISMRWILLRYLIKGHLVQISRPKIIYWDMIYRKICRLLWYFSLWFCSVVLPIKQGWPYIFIHISLNTMQRGILNNGWLILICPCRGKDTFIVHAWIICFRVSLRLISMHLYHASALQSSLLDIIIILLALVFKFDRSRVCW